MVTRNRSARSILAAFAMLLFSAASHATTLSWGDIAEPGSRGMNAGGLLGQIEHDYTFSIQPGTSFLFSAWASTGFVSRYGILDFEGELYKDDVLLVSGISSVPSLPPFPSFNVDFEPVVLGAGDYLLRLTGLAFGAFEGITASYSGLATFEAAPVPEPPSLVLALLGIGGVAGVMQRHRRRG